MLTLGSLPVSTAPEPSSWARGEHLETAKAVFVEVFYRVKQIAVEGHQATWTGAKSGVTVRRSVRVHPYGGVIRSE